MPLDATTKAPTEDNTQLALFNQSLNQVSKDLVAFVSEFKEFRVEWKESCEKQDERLHIQEIATSGLKIIVDNHQVEINNLRKTNSVWSFLNTAGIAVMGYFGMKN